MIDESSAIVVSRFPVGPGNFKNLEAARYALDRGKKVFVLREPGGQGIDFIGGRADTYISGLISSGAIPVESVEDLVSSLAEIVR